MLTTNVGELTFAFVGGSAVPFPVSLNVDVTGGLSQPFTYAAGTPPWLQISAPPGTVATPETLTITVTPQIMPTGFYVAQIILTPTATGGIPVIVPVLLTVQGSTSINANRHRSPW